MCTSIANIILFLKHCLQVLKGEAEEELPSEVFFTGDFSLFYSEFSRQCGLSICLTSPTQENFQRTNVLP